MGCLKYEFIKLGKKGTFLIMCVLLLATNLLAFYMSEKPTSEFSLVFEQRENYDAYLDGDIIITAKIQRHRLLILPPIPILSQGWLIASSRWGAYLSLQIRTAIITGI